MQVFLEECVVPDLNAMIVKKEFRAVYGEWCDRQGVHRLSDFAIKEALKSSSHAWMSVAKMPLTNTVLCAGWGSPGARTRPTIRPRLSLSAEGLYEGAFPPHTICRKPTWTSNNPA